MKKSLHIIVLLMGALCLPIETNAYNWVNLEYNVDDENGTQGTTQVDLDEVERYMTIQDERNRPYREGGLWSSTEEGQYIRKLHNHVMAIGYWTHASAKQMIEDAIKNSSSSTDRAALQNILSSFEATPPVTIDMIGSKEMNAFYSPGEHLIRMQWYFDASGDRHDTAQSADILRHELWHRILYGLWYELGYHSTAQAGGFHEGMGDVGALLTRLINDTEALQVAAKQSLGKLSDSPATAHLAEAFGSHLGQSNGLRNMAEAVKLNNDLGDPTITKIASNEVHDMGEVWASVIFNILEEKWHTSLDPHTQMQFTLHKVAQELMQLQMVGIARAKTFYATRRWDHPTYHRIASEMYHGALKMSYNGTGDSQWSALIAKHFQRHGIYVATDKGALKDPWLGLGVSKYVKIEADGQWQLVKGDDMQFAQVKQIISKLPADFFEVPKTPLGWFEKAQQAYGVWNIVSPYFSQPYEAATAFWNAMYPNPNAENDEWETDSESGDVAVDEGDNSSIAGDDVVNPAPVSEDETDEEPVAPQNPASNDEAGADDVTETQAPAADAAPSESAAEEPVGDTTAGEEIRPAEEDLPGTDADENKDEADEESTDSTEEEEGEQHTTDQAPQTAAL